MMKGRRSLVSIGCLVLGLVSPLGCGDEDVETVPRGAEPGQETIDAGDASVENGGPFDGSIADAADADAADGRVSWDAGPEPEVPTIHEFWTRGYVYCARVERSSGTNVECWGLNQSGELGRGAVSVSGTTFIPQPIQSPEAPGISLVAANGAFQRGQVCAVMATRELKCWGGAYDFTRPVQPAVPDAPLLTDVSSVEMSTSFACALRTDGAVACWGANTLGQLGLGAIDYVSHPTPTNIAGFTGSQVVVGANHACALRDGNAWCWGSRIPAGAGVGSGNITKPTQVAGLSGITKLQIRDQFTFALTDDKSLWYWGTLGSKVAYVPTKVLDPTPDDPSHPLSDVDDVVAGCVLLTGGKVKCLPGYVGGTYQFSEIPRVENVVRLGASCALDTTGTLRCWGDNAAGQLGISPTVLSNLSGSVPIHF